MTTTSEQPGADLVPVVTPATLALFAQMAVGIPEADDSEAYEQIVLQLLSATDVDGLNAPWDTTAADKLNGHRLKIDTIERRPSDYSAGLGIYLVCKGTDMGTGEKFVWSTGSVSVVAQLTRAWFLQKFPVIAELEVADTPTASGGRPQHLTIIAFGGSK